jgi:hypothetical protein
MYPEDFAVMSLGDFKWMFDNGQKQYVEVFAARKDKLKHA